MILSNLGYRVGGLSHSFFLIEQEKTLVVHRETLSFVAVLQSLAHSERDPGPDRLGIWPITRDISSITAALATSMP